MHFLPYLSLEIFWSFSLIFVDQISTVNDYVMLMSSLGYNWNNALGIRASGFITMKEHSPLNLFFCSRLVSPMHCNIHFSKSKGEHTTNFPNLSLLYIMHVHIHPHPERHSLIRRNGAADLFQLPLCLLSQQQPQSFRRAKSITAELLLAASIKGMTGRTKRSVSLQIHQSFSQEKKLHMKLCMKVRPAVFPSRSGAPKHSYGEASKTSLCAQLSPESKTGTSSGLHLI